MKISKKWRFVLLLTGLCVGGLVINACGGSEPSPKNSKIPVYTPGAKGWVMSWSDEFNTGSLNPNVWVKCDRGTADWCKNMSSDPSLYTFGADDVELWGVVNPDTQKDPVPYLTAGICTKGKKAFAPGGYIEIKAKLQGAKGAWPAIWMLPFDTKKYQWPNGGEVDICERLNFDAFAHQTVHSHWTYDLKRRDPNPTKTSAIDPNGYNTYGAQILPDKVVFFINGKATLEYPKVDGGADGQFPYDIPMYLLIDMQLGGSWVGEVNPADLPIKMTVDYVRYWEYKP